MSLVEFCSVYATIWESQISRNTYEDPVKRIRLRISSRVNIPVGGLTINRHKTSWVGHSSSFTKSCIEGVVGAEYGSVVYWRCKNF